MVRSMPQASPLATGSEDSERGVQPDPDSQYENIRSTQIENDQGA